MAETASQRKEGSRKRKDKDAREREVGGRRKDGDKEMEAAKMRMATVEAL